MRGSRVKALRRSFRQTYGYNPAKTRRIVEPIRAKNWLQKLWWKIVRHKPTHLVMYFSQWRRWKNLAKASYRVTGHNPRPTNPGVFKRRRKAA